MVFTSCSEITNVNNLDTNVKLTNTCYKLLRLSRGNGEKNIIIIYKNSCVPFHVDEFESDFTETALILHFNCQIKKFLFPRVVSHVWKKQV